MDWLLNTFSTLVIVFAGLIMTAFSGWSVYHLFRVTFCWPKTSARILRYWIKRGDGQPFFHPVVKFQTSDSRVVVTISNWGCWRRTWPAGSIVPVYYNPANPQWVEVHCFGNLLGFSLTSVGLSIGVAASIYFFGLWWLPS